MGLKLPKYTHSDELDQELMDAHKMLKDIGVPIAPLKDVKIGYDKDYRKLYTGRCGYIEGNGHKPFYMILLHPLHKRSQKEQQDGDRFDLSRRSTILHELVHTCKDTKTAKGLYRDHNQAFRNYGKYILEKTGYNILSTVNAEDLKHSSSDEPVLLAVCKECGNVIPFYSGRDYQLICQATDQLEECGYCGKSLELCNTDMTIAPPTFTNTCYLGATVKGKPGCLVVPLKKGTNIDNIVKRISRTPIGMETAAFIATEKEELASREPVHMVKTTKEFFDIYKTM